MSKQVDLWVKENYKLAKDKLSLERLVAFLQAPNKVLRTEIASKKLYPRFVIFN